MRQPFVPGTPEARDALLAAATQAAGKAYATRSGVHVGAAVLSAAGRIHAGCNVENAAFPLGNCAEPAAIAAGVSPSSPRASVSSCTSAGRTPCCRP
jgi:cytidine deaminase